MISEETPTSYATLADTVLQPVAQALDPVRLDKKDVDLWMALPGGINLNIYYDASHDDLECVAYRGYEDKEGRWTTDSSGPSYIFSHQFRLRVELLRMYGMLMPGQWWACHHDNLIVDHSVSFVVTRYNLLPMDAVTCSNRTTEEWVDMVFEWPIGNEPTYPRRCVTCGNEAKWYPEMDPTTNTTPPKEILWFEVQR